MWLRVCVCVCVCCDEEDAPLCSLTSFVPFASERRREGGREREATSMKWKGEWQRMSLYGFVKLFKKAKHADRAGPGHSECPSVFLLTSHLLIPLAVRVFCAMASFSLRRLRAESRKVLPKVT